MLNGSDEQEVASRLQTLESYMHSRGWEVNATKNQEPSISVKFLGFQWPGVYQIFPFKTEDKVLHLEEGNVTTLGLLGFCRRHVPTPGKTALAHTLGDLKACHISGGPEQVQAGPATVLLEPYGTSGRDHRQVQRA